MSTIHGDLATTAQNQLPLATDDAGTSGKVPMTASQAAELLYLSQRAEQPEAYDDTLTADEALARIARLKRKLDG